MRQRQQKRARGFLSRGALISLLLHVNIFGPIILAAWIYGGEEEAQRNAEVDVAFEDGATANLPEDLPPIETPPEALDAQKPEKQKPDPRKKKIEVAKQEPAKKEADKTKPKPEPEVVVPPLPPMPPEPPPPPEPRKGHEKMVDLDNGKDVPPPPDAKYLAEKNNRAEVETRAEDTNLERNQKGEGQASAPSERDEPQPGADKRKIAELEDEKSALGRKAPEVTPHEKPVVAAPTPEEQQQQKKSLLALRDPAPKVHELTPETADLSLPRAADGDLAENRAVRGKKSNAAKLPPGKRVKLAITGDDYEYMFGADAEAERRLAQKQRSMKVGKHLQKLAHMGSALENFIPEVKPGNQTALNTRAAPFAAYIARMHRSIHKLWGFGALEDWDELGSGSPLNNPALMTALEIVMNGDGTVDKVSIVKSSGYLPYDAAAMDVAYSAGPYPDPPRAIRSKNGKIYVHWRFFRDERQCATSNVDYFILDNAPKGSDQPEGPTVTESPEPASSPGAARPAAPSGSAASPTSSASGTPASAPAAGSPGVAPPPPPGGAPAGPSLFGDPTSPGTTGGSGGLRRLSRTTRSSGGRHAGGMQRLDQEVAAAEAQDGAGRPASPETLAPARASDPVAHAAAERWFAALAAGDTNALAGMASLPFKTSGKEVAKKAQLAAMLADLVEETKGGRAHAVQVFTAGGLRAALGKLPPNLEDGSGSQLYAVASTDPHDALILVLGQRAGGWYPIGLVRR